MTDLTLNADSALQDFGIPGYTHLVGHTAFLDFIVKDVPPNNRRGVLRFLELASNKGIGLTQKQLLDLAKVPGVTRRTLDTVSSLNKACTYFWARDNSEPR